MCTRDYDFEYWHDSQFSSWSDQREDQFLLGWEYSDMIKMKKQQQRDDKIKILADMVVRHDFPLGASTLMAHFYDRYDVLLSVDDAEQLKHEILEEVNLIKKEANNGN